MQSLQNTWPHTVVTSFRPSFSKAEAVSIHTGHLSAAWGEAEGGEGREGEGRGRRGLGSFDLSRGFLGRGGKLWGNEWS